MRLRQLLTDERLLKKLCYLLTTISILTFSFAIYRWYQVPGTPLRIWDETDYFRSGGNFYENPTFKVLWNSGRPNFLWLPAILLKLFQISVTANRFSIITSLLAWGIILVSLWRTQQLVNAPTTLLLFSLSVLCTVPNIHFFSAGALMPDLIHAASFIGLVVASANLVCDPRASLFSLLVYLGIGIFGLFTKPIFLMPLMLISTATVVYAITDPQLSRRAKTRITLSSTLLFLLAVRFAIRYRGLINELYFNNEVLGYWAPAHGIFSHVLWYPSILLEELPLATVCTISTLVFVFAFARSARLKTESFKFLSLLWGPWFVMTLYASLLVRSKDSRTFFFLILFPLIFLPLSFGKKFVSRNRELSTLFLTLIAVNLVTTLALAFPSTHGQAILFKRISAPNQKLLPSFFFRNAITYENVGVETIYQIIARDCTSREKHCPPKTLSLFLPHSWFTNNESIFERFTLIKPTSPNRSITSWQPPWSVRNGIYRYGGWGMTGGIPSSFFTSRYVVYYPKVRHWHLLHNVELYNKVILNELSTKDSSFTDGLEEIAQVKTDMGIAYILRRQHLPSKEHFLNIVSYFKKIDADNWWNHPYFDAAEKLELQTLALPQTHLERFQSKESPPQHTQVSHFPPAGDYSYPNLFEKIK